MKTIREKLENKGCRDPCRPMAKGGPLVVQRTGESVSFIHCHLISSQLIIFSLSCRCAVNEAVQCALVIRLDFS